MFKSHFINVFVSLCGELFVHVCFNFFYCVFSPLSLNFKSLKKYVKYNSPLPVVYIANISHPIYKFSSDFVYAVFFPCKIMSFFFLLLWILSHC